MCEICKISLYAISNIHELSLEQEHVTIVYEDNQGVITMSTSRKSTERTKHINTRYFDLQSWVEQELKHLKRIPTLDSTSNAMIKNTSRIQFNYHTDYIIDKHIPHNTPIYTTPYKYDTQINDALSTGR